MRRLWQGIVALTLAALLAGPAQAFFPIGGFSSTGNLYLRTWDLREFDTNNDGSVQTGEGLEILIESGPSGFTTAELAAVRESFQVWEDVPTAYVAFRFNDTYTDPVFTGLQTDFLTTVAMQVNAADDSGAIPDPPDTSFPIAFPILGVTVTLFTVEEEVFEIGGQAFTVSPGTIVDCDIVIDAESHRRAADGTPPLVDLKATMVHEVGHLLGLDHPPLNNLQPILSDPTDPTSIAGAVEQEVFWHTEPNGIARFIGVTPTMFPFAFETENAIGERNDGSADLAPDDISGISWLYPRGSQVNFFNLADEARTQSRGIGGFPSVPILGAHVVAWADIDNNPATTRVPMFSTMTGLYVNLDSDQLEGRFNLLGLWKQFEVPRSTQGTLFNPTYTFTINPLNDLSFTNQSPPGGGGPSAFDSIQGEGSHSASTRGADEYNNAFISEVFRETENIFGVQNRDGGTPLVWNFERNGLISADTGRTLAQMLQGRPMFGDRNDVCPLNVIYGDAGGGGDDGGGGGGGGGDDGGDDEDDVKLLAVGTVGGGGGPGILRGLRDNYLLKTAAGTAAVDLYYSLSPHVAQYLLKNGTAADWFRSGVSIMYWILAHTRLLFPLGLLGLAVLTGCTLWRRRSSRAALAAGALLLSCAALPAEARIAFVTTAQMTESASAVITGKVTSVSGRVFENKWIVTDVVVDVEESLKGEVAKQTQVTVTLLGGTAAGRRMHVSEMPSFRAGQDVLLYLREDSRLGGYTVHGGIRGTFMIRTDSKSGERFVNAFEHSLDPLINTDLQQMGKQTVASEKQGAPDHDHSDHGTQERPEIPLGEYLSWLQEVIDGQEQAAEE